MKKWILVAAVLLLASGCIAADFSADFDISDSNGKSRSAKWFVSGDKCRQEENRDGARVTIYRPDMKLKWKIYPAKKQYEQFPLSGGHAAKLADLKKQGFKQIGKEKVAGLTCRKLRGTRRGSGGAVVDTVTMWYADALDFTIKTEVKSASETVTIVFSNIKRAKQPSSLFELPKGLMKVIVQAEPSPKPGAGGKK